MHRTSALLREARTQAGLTQAELARRAGTTQSVVARMEAPGANPRVESLEALLGAMRRGLELAPAPKLPPVDEGQIVEQLRLTPVQRLARHDASKRNLRKLVQSAKRVGR
jgi:transcriptional regulator with XRE-family HTH domain